MRLRHVAAGCAALLVLAVPSVAGARRAVGEVLSHAKSAFGAEETVVGAGSGEVYFQNGDGLYGMDTGGGATTLVAPGGRALSTAVSNLLYRNPDGTVRWRKPNGHEVDGDTTWRAIAPTGGLIIYDNGGSPILELQAGKNGVVTYLGPAGLLDQVISTSTGVIDVTSGFNPTARFIEYAGSHDSTTVKTTSIDTEIECNSATDGAVGCAAVDGSAAYRLSLTGAAPQIIPSNDTVDDVVVTKTATIWRATKSNGTTTLNSRPAAGGTTKTLAGAHPAALVGNATTAFYSIFGVHGTAGISSVTSAAGNPAKLRTSPAADLTAGPVAIGPGRVAWSDDSKTSGPVWSRGISGGATTQVGTSGIGSGPSVTDDDRPPLGQPAVAVSGPRTAFARYAGASVTRPVRTYEYTVFDGADTIKIPGATAEAVTLSGTHLLYHRDSDGHWLLYDLLAHKVTDLTKSLGLTSANFGVGLWGDYLAYFKSDGAVWRTQLSTGAKKQVLAALKYPTFTYGVIVLDGNHLAAGRSYFDSGFGQHRGTTVATIGGKATTINGVWPVSGSVGGFVVEVDTDQYELRPWDGSKPINLPDTPREPTVYANQVGYLVADGKPRIATLSRQFSNAPRALNAAQAKKSVKRSKSWHFMVPTSAELTSCRLVLKTGTKTVRTLSCSKALAAQGQATLTWNGKDSKGKLAAKSTYTWTLSASNRDGKLPAMSGKVTVG